jgi:protein-tyrosine phosphatase
MKYGILFTIAAALFAVAAMTHGGWWWLLLWPAASFAWVALGYLALGPSVFAKRADGSLPRRRTLLLAPYLVYLWSVWRLVRLVKREPATDALLPDVWIGRRLLSAELPDHIERIIDLTCEFPATRFGRVNCRYKNLPLLDASAPAVEDLLGLLGHIQAERGPLLIHCAEGHGRTGLVSAALLLNRGLAETPEDAIARVQAVRPLVRLNSAQRRCLEQVASILANGRTAATPSRASEREQGRQ